MEKIIEVKGLHKSYGEVHAVKGIDFYVEKGKLFAFLGPNGAGKSTTIDVICTFLKQDEGAVTVDGRTVGKDDRTIRNEIGAVFQDGLLDQLLTIEENLKCRGSLYGLKGKALSAAVKRTAEITGVTELLKRPYGKLSGGQRRRCDIARALINTPKILFLDEPTTGLDPQTRKSVWETVTKIQKESGMTVFMTTHYMEEAAGADYVIIIDNGEISAKGTPAELKEKYSKDRLVLTCKDTQAVAEKLKEMGVSYKISADTVQAELPATMDALPILESCRYMISGFEVLKGTMDDAFIAVTGKEIRQ
ncbi:MAG TPA: ABC transporter ATP-binding protein [Oscillospiraceae bacterium]|nr:ABC transporter ATP-binding protein [Oscillospiraceae bacterium]HPS33768.1 ABC transporter ATP-binding protein [Oscillospiraceae bacterium]